MAVGLDTLNWLSEDLVANPPVINRGQISLAECRLGQLSLRRDLLQEIPID